MFDILETIVDILAKPPDWSWRRHFATIALILVSISVVIYLGWATSKWWLAPQL